MKLNFRITKDDIKGIIYFLLIFSGLFLPSLIIIWNEASVFGLILFIVIHLVASFPMLFILICIFTRIVEIIIYQSGWFKKQKLKELWKIEQKGYFKIDRWYPNSDETIYMIHANIILLAFAILNFTVYLINGDDIVMILLNLKHI